MKWNADCFSEFVGETGKVSFLPGMFKSTKTHLNFQSFDKHFPAKLEQRSITVHRKYDDDHKKNLFNKDCA